MDMSIRSAGMCGMYNKESPSITNTVYMSRTTAMPNIQLIFPIEPIVVFQQICERTDTVIPFHTAVARVNHIKWTLSEAF